MEGSPIETLSVCFDADQKRHETITTRYLASLLCYRPVNEFCSDICVSQLESGNSVAYINSIVHIDPEAPHTSTGPHLFKSLTDWPLGDDGSDFEFSL